MNYGIIHYFRSMSSSAEADDRFNIDPERLNQIAGEREDSERIVAVARMLMAQRARNTLDGLVGEYETPEEPDLTVTTVEEFFVVLAKRRIDQVKRETAMPQRIKFAKGFEMNLDGWNLTGCDLRNIDFS